jgi:hypothetical protein
MFKNLLALQPDVSSTKINAWCHEIFSIYESDIPTNWDLSVPVICKNGNKDLFFRAFFYNKNENGTISLPTAFVEAPFPHSTQSDWVSKFEHYPTNCELQGMSSALQKHKSDESYYMDMTYGVFGGVYESVIAYYQAEFMEYARYLSTFRKIFFKTTPVAHHIYYRNLNPHFFDWLDVAYKLQPPIENI